MKHTITHRVIYADTDNFGVVYYGRYLEWLERGRAEVLRAAGVTYAEFEKEGIFAPVVHLEVDYKHPAKYDEELQIETTIKSMGNSSMHFQYRIMKEDILIAEASTVNVFVKKNGTKVKISEKIKQALA
jgi:acyl-CoA thioester hydrolase